MYRQTCLDAIRPFPRVPPGYRRIKPPHIETRVGLAVPILPFTGEPEKAVASWNTTHPEFAFTLGSVGPKVLWLCIRGNIEGGGGGGQYQ